VPELVVNLSLGPRNHARDCSSQANLNKSQGRPIKGLKLLPNGHASAEESLGVFHPNDFYAIKRLSERSHVNSGVIDFEQRGLRRVGGMMPAKSIIAAISWNLIMVAAKRRRREWVKEGDRRGH
jgi:hypothetical protein